MFQLWWELIIRDSDKSTTNLNKLSFDGLWIRVVNQEFENDSTIHSSLQRTVKNRIYQQGR